MQSQEEMDLIMKLNELDDEITDLQELQNNLEDELYSIQQGDENDE
jgi:hypothetical protein